MKYFIIAGEASGDLHGSNLMRGLYAEDNDAEIRFWGGSLMNEVHKAYRKEDGLLQDYKDGAIIGFIQVALHAGSYLRKFSRCCEQIMQFKPDAVILIDYPGFNFRVAEFAHNNGFKVYYYIAPKVWASRENRVRKLKKFVDMLFIIFPFEKEYFTKKEVPFIYKGNPLIDAIDNNLRERGDRESFFKRNNLEDKPYIALLAGSRKGELTSMMPTFMSFAEKLRALPQYSGYHFILAGAPSMQPEDYAKYIAGREEYVHVVFGESYTVIKNAEAAVVNSGTASLETALIGTPQVVAYKGFDINFNIAKQIIKIRFISLGNLILGRSCFKELLQYYFTPDTVLWEVRRMIEDKDYREEMLAGYQEIRENLGGSGASVEVAKAMIAEMRKG